MTPEEIRKAIVAVEPKDVFETDIPTVFRNEWNTQKNGAKFCILYTVLNGTVAATPAICLPGHNEKEAIEEGCKRFARF